MKFKSLLIAASLFVFGTAGSASALSFDLSGSASTSSSFTVLGDDGITSLTVTGFSGNSASNVRRDSNGMGVYSGGSDDTQVDGNGPDETLRFTFASGSYTLLSVLFNPEFVGSDDDFNLTVDGSYKGQSDIPSNGLYVFQSIHTGLVFDFGVTETNDDYKIRAIAFRPNGGDNGVPEPSTFGLLGLGIAAGIYRRRQRAA